MNKSYLILFTLALLFFVGFNVWNTRAQESAKKNTAYAVKKTDDQWKKELSPEAYRVLRHHATERPNTSPLNKVKEPGTFSCAGCGQELFKTEHKFDSGTGWPSFFQPIGKEALGTTVDYKLVVPRTEVHCSRCGGHLGHVFGDGPRPTGKRYCINGVSLTFEPKGK